MTNCSLYKITGLTGQGSSIALMIEYSKVRTVWNRSWLHLSKCVRYGPSLLLRIEEVKDRRTGGIIQRYDIFNLFY